MLETAIIVSTGIVLTAITLILGIDMGRRYATRESLPKGKPYSDTEAIRRANRITNASELRSYLHCWQAGDYGMAQVYSGEIRLEDLIAESEKYND